MNTNLKLNKYIYKYRPFDEYTYDMLENKYLFLPAPEKFDDDTECVTDIALENILDSSRKDISLVTIKYLLKIVLPYASNDAVSKAEDIIYSCMNRNGNIQNNLILEIDLKLREFLPIEECTKITNYLARFNLLIENNYEDQFKELIDIAINARKRMGICSLSIDSNNEDLWHRYANDYSGYCIEYDLENYEHIDSLYKVNYVKKEERNNNVILAIVANMLGQFIRIMSNNNIEADISQYLSLFLTKYDSWKCQNEWRLIFIDKAYEKINAPKINKVILGKNISEKDKNEMIQFCDKLKIKYELL